MLHVAECLGWTGSMQTRQLKICTAAMIIETCMFVIVLDENMLVLVIGKPQ